jgi:hypothetical protein
MAWFRKRKEKDPAETSRELRQQALSVRASDLGLATSTSRVWGLLMETAYPEAVATLVAFADGTTSLYFSTGGGTIGAGDHATVRMAAEEFLRIASDHVDQFTRATEYPLPNIGRVRFYVHTLDGVLTADRNEEDLGYERDPLSPVFHAGHAVIGAIRELDESQ